MKHILLVEDDVWLAELYQGALQSLKGTTIHWATDPEDALELLDKQSVDLMLLDMFLPRHNGIALLHELASHSDTIDLPVIILSAVAKHDFAMPERRWLEYGVVDYLYKPAMKPSQIVATVQRHLVQEKTAS